MLLNFQAMLECTVVCISVPMVTCSLVRAHNKALPAGLELTFDNQPIYLI